MHVNFDPDALAAETIGFSDFLKLDIRVGTIVSAEPFPKARKASYKLEIDFGGGIGLKKSAAQITTLYTIEDLKDRQVVAVVNLQPRQIANFMSEVLILGFSNANGDVVLLSPDSSVTNGARLS